MKSFRAFLAFFLSLGAFFASPAYAGPAGVGEDKPSLIVGYYVVPSGKEDEWLALYKKWHYPIMQHMVEEGVITSVKMYAPGLHSRGVWSFRVVFTAPPAGKGAKSPLSNADRVRKLYPDLKEYLAAEKARWALTLDHWDEFEGEVDLNVDHPSVFYPGGNDLTAAN